MPLAVFCGGPLSGKTERASRLAKALQGESQPVVLLNEEFLSLDKKQIYRGTSVGLSPVDFATEKIARATIIAAVERYLTKGTVVVVDYLNYIKGFRYQLYCIARAIGTTHCTIYCAFTAREAIFRQSVCQVYASEQQIQEIYGRFEEPDPFAKWDHPLFVKNASDKDENWGEVTACLLHGRAPRPNLSTVVNGDPPLDYLQLLEKAAAEVSGSISKWLLRGNVIVGKCDVGGGMFVEIGRPTTNGEIKRLQMQFLALNKLHQLPSVDAIRLTYIAFLNKNLQR